MKKAKEMRWTRWHWLSRTAVIFGIVPDFTRGSMMQLNKKLAKLIADGEIEKRKLGTAQSAPAEYRSKHKFNVKTGRRE